MPRSPHSPAPSAAESSRRAAGLAAELPPVVCTPTDGGHAAGNTTTLHGSYLDPAWHPYPPRIPPPPQLSPTSPPPTPALPHSTQHHLRPRASSHLSPAQPHAYPTYRSLRAHPTITAPAPHTPHHTPSHPTASCCVPSHLTASPAVSPAAGKRSALFDRHYAVRTSRGE